MEVEFIPLCKLGVGPVLIRYSEIMLIELTPGGYTRLDLSYGDHIIVEEEPFEILRKIKAAKALGEADSKDSKDS